MTHPLKTRAEAMRLRDEDDLTMYEIAERLGLSRSTVYGWIRPLGPLKIPRDEATWRQKAAASNERTWAARRQAAYAAGTAEFDVLVKEPGFRDFVCMYIGEGFKRNRGVVSICNSDTSVLVLGQRWMQRFSRNKISYAVQYHADQELAVLCEHWSGALGIEPEDIRLQRKSNSSAGEGRVWRSEHGVLTVATNDTYFRSRLQAWMDRLRDEWI